jgi:hypothetical protein
VLAQEEKLMTSKKSLEALEQRVQTLEQEFDILKQQIQAALLDIQEQLLTNAHPSLRAEDPAVSASGQSIAVPEQRAQPLSAIHSVPATASPPEAEQGGSSGGESASPPAVRKVSLDDLVPSPPESPAQQHETTAVAPAAPEVDWSDQARLERWVKGKVAEMGGERTRSLIEAYARKGRFSAQIQRTLLELVAIYDTNGMSSPKRIGNQRVSTQTQVEQGARPGLRSQNGTSSSQSVPQSPGSDRLKPVAQERSRASRDASPADEFSEEEVFEDEKQHLVLRLIAGVQNASAGVFRKRKEG